MKFDENKGISLFFLFIMTIGSISCLKEKSRKWCWTKSMVNEPTFALNTKIGGFNWGFCQKRDPNENSVKYTAIVETSSKKNSETTSTISLKLMGSLGKSNYLTLGDGFERDSTKKIPFDGPDVGSLKKIELKLIGSQPYRCKSITIFNGSKSYRFECLNNMIPCSKDFPNDEKCKMSAEVDGNIPYEITLKTSDEKKSGTHSSILLNILGKKGASNAKLISDNGLKRGSSRTINININDVGETTGFKLELAEEGQWKPTLLIIKNLINQQQKRFDLENVLLINPGKAIYKLDMLKKKNNSKKPSRALKVHDTNGGLMNYSDFKKIINLTCNQKLINPSPSQMIFGPDYPTRRVNYLNILARCPSNCHLLNEKAFGLGIHPEMSPICLSALADNAISYYGGIITISILPGLDQYNVYDNAKKIKKFGKSKKSYTVMKLDNVDIVDKDIRILNDKGILSNEGRVEFRREGEWGTVCAFGNNDLSAKRICMDIGYKDGEWRSPSDQRAKNYCKAFKSKNYCGAKNIQIYFSDIVCAESDKNINSCNKLQSDPKICTHDYDAIINCFNENYEIEKFIPDGIIRLGKNILKNSISYGRLEIFSKQKFHPICNLEFSIQAANVACAQMGYEKGELITGVSAKKYQLDLNDETAFAAEKLKCDGKEAKIMDCKFNTVDINCKHDMDVVLQCKKGKGDPTGKSQHIKPVSNPPPKLGKLGLMKHKIDCDAKGDNMKFRGDPGSIYLVECPANCGKADGTVWGTGSYTSNSNVCKAAIHVGVIQNKKGGLFVLSRTYGQTYYLGFKNNGITSTEYYGRWPASIIFSNTNSAYTNMNALIFPSFLEKNSMTTLVQRSLSYFKRRSSSFIESSQNIGIPSPIFEWVQNDFTYKFSSTNNLIIKNHKLTAISNFSLLLRFEMLAFKNSPAYLFSFSGCNGFNVLLDEEDNLLLGDPCDASKRIKLGYMVPIKDKTLLFVNSLNGVVNVKIFSSRTKGVFKKSFSKKLEFNNPGQIGIGRKGVENKGFFFGSIDFIQIYEKSISPKLIGAILNGMKLSPKPGVFVKEKTLDNRKCLTPCTTNPIPGKKGSGKPPKKANKNQAKSQKIKSNIQISTLQSIDVECDTSIMDKRFSGSPGTIFRVNCKSCSASKGVVFGTAIYHPLSSICKSASHSGILKKDKSGTILVEILPGQMAYNGSKGIDGKISATFSGAKTSFKVKKAQKLTEITCDTKANDLMFAKAALSTKFAVVCPKDCGKFKGEVFGTEIYSEDSSICLSALHFGLMSEKGGEAYFIIDNGLNRYLGSKGFGIMSQAKGAHVRSFKFIGNKASLDFTYKETYQGMLKQTYNMNIISRVINKKSDDWKYFTTNEFSAQGINKNFKVISHEGNVLTSQANEFASWIDLKGADFVNGKVLFNFFLFDKNPIALMFRYKDKQNYYALEISAKFSNNIKLIQRLNGKSKVIMKKSIKISVKKWHKLTLIMHFSSFKFKLQSHIIRQNKTIIKKELYGISRGSIGFGTNGNNKFYINGIKIDKYNPKKKSSFKNNKRTWNSIVKKVQYSDRRIYCRGLYNSMTKELPRCMEIHNYCKLRCDESIPPVENILNYSCTSNCVRTYNLIEGKSNVKSHVKDVNWKPRVNEKCDYLPTGHKHFKMCKIIKISNKKGSNEKLIKIVYFPDSRTKIKEEVVFPSESIQKCGAKLTGRQDCLFK